MQCLIAISTEHDGKANCIRSVSGTFLSIKTEKIDAENRHAVDFSMKDHILRMHGRSLSPKCKDLHDQLFPYLAVKSSLPGICLSVFFPVQLVYSCTRANMFFVFCYLPPTSNLTAHNSTLSELQKPQPTITKDKLYFCFLILRKEEGVTGGQTVHLYKEYYKRETLFQLRHKLLCLQWKISHK